VYILAVGGLRKVYKQCSKMRDKNGEALSGRVLDL
jgi:hypothetical protein